MASGLCTGAFAVYAILVSRQNVKQLSTAIQIEEPIKNSISPLPYDYKYIICWNLYKI